MKRIWITLIVLGLLGMVLSFPWPQSVGHNCLAHRLLSPASAQIHSDRQDFCRDFFCSYGLVWMSSIVVLAFGTFGLLWGRKQVRRGTALALAALALLPSLSAPVALAQEGLDTAVRLNLQSLIEETVANNPEIESAREAARAARERISPAGALPDPMFGLKAANFPIREPRLSGSPMTAIQLELSQGYPYPGKLGLRAEAAERQAEATGAGVDIVTNRVVADLRRVYYDLAFNYRATAITERNKSLLQDLARIAQVKYSVGNGLQQDVLKSQVAISRISERLLDLGEQRAVLAARLNAILHRAVDAPLAEPDSLTVPAFQWDYDRIETAAREHNPLLKLGDRQVENRDALYRLARLGTRPDFAFGLGYGLRAAGAGEMTDGADLFSAFVAINLPLYHRSKQDPEARAALNARESVRRDRESAEDMVLSRARSIYEQITNSQRKYDLYRMGILPEASGSLESARAGYQVDKVDFLTLLNSQSTLYDYEIQYHRVVAELNKQLSDLEEIIGADPDSLETGNQNGGSGDDDK